MKRKKKKKNKSAIVRDKHLLYEASVQNPEADLEFFEKIFRKRRSRPLRQIREDFCGTAALACEWVRSGDDRTAIGVDLHAPTLDWGRKHHVARLGDRIDRLELVCDDVLSVIRPKVDLIAALNFSYFVFKTREELRRYFRRARRALVDDGMLVLDVFGGTEAMIESEEEREIDASKSLSGVKIPAFTYVWDQARFNAVNHHIKCFIHFELPDGTRIRKAFRYDWRLWTLPELQEVLLESGFAKAEVYMEGWDEDEEDGDGNFTRRRFFENQEGWVGYVVGLV